MSSTQQKNKKTDVLFNTGSHLCKPLVFAYVNKIMEAYPDALIASVQIELDENGGVLIVPVDFRNAIRVRRVPIE